MAVDPEHLSKDDLGQLIRDGENDIVCEQNGYVIRNSGTGDVVVRVTVSQDAQSVDMEDRIVKMKAYLAGDSMRGALLNWWQQGN
jgi:hypothetical protein